MKQRMEVTVILAAIFFGTCCSANAEIFTVELPEFLGPLDENTDTKTAAFDFGVSFLQINEVSIQLSGTLTPGLAHGDGLWNPIDEWRDVPGDMELLMDPGEGWWGIGFFVRENPFLLEGSFDRLLGATWDFLLDGTDEVTLSFGPAGLVGWDIVTDPTANVTGAYLTVDGVVPEPATVLLLGIGAIAIRLRKNKG